MWLLHKSEFLKIAILHKNTMGVCQNWNISTLITLCGLTNFFGAPTYTLIFIQEGYIQEGQPQFGQKIKKFIYMMTIPGQRGGEVRMPHHHFPKLHCSNDDVILSNTYVNQTPPLFSYDYWHRVSHLGILVNLLSRISWRIQHAFVCICS